MQPVRGEAACPASVSADCHWLVTIRRIVVARLAPRYVGSADVSLTFCIGMSVFTLSTPGMRVRYSIWKRR